MDWWAQVDIYCERTAPGFWNEPLNALTNAAFVLAALMAARTAAARGRQERDLWVLIVMAAVIGVGSFLFHTYATVWSGFADTLPIWSFVAYFVFVAIHRIGGVAPGRLTAIFLGVAALIVVVTLAAGDGSAPAADSPPPGPSPLNGSEQYAPALLALLVFSWVAWRRGSPMAPWVAAATAVFVVSLAFRTVDLALCPGWPAGTHFMWHLLNATLIGLLLQGLIRSLPDRPSDAPTARAGPAIG